MALPHTPHLAPFMSARGYYIGCLTHSNGKSDIVARALWICGPMLLPQFACQPCRRQEAVGEEEDSHSAALRMAETKGYRTKVGADR